MSVLARYLLASATSVALTLFFLIVAVNVSPWFFIGAIASQIGAYIYIATIACPSCGRSVMMRYRPVLLWWPPRRCPHCNFLLDQGEWRDAV